MKAFIILENGRVFEGQSMGATEETVCEMVFNTSMTGYQEVLTDPSYAGQGIVMTYPLIGNYGVNDEDPESAKPWPGAFIVRHLSPRGSNFRCQGSLEEYLRSYGITGVQGVDTREITRILRGEGVMNGMVTCDPGYDKDACVEKKIKRYRVRDTVREVTSKEVRHYAGDRV
jgi:carbamoyl-phosphate synthase small subunit